MIASDIEILNFYQHYIPMHRDSVIQCGSCVVVMKRIAQCKTEHALFSAPPALRADNWCHYRRTELDEKFSFTMNVLSDRVDCYYKLNGLGVSEKTFNKSFSDNF